MARNKHSKENEYYLGEIRQLKSENKKLKRRLRDLEKREHNFDHVEDEIEIEQVKAKCQSCGKGDLEEISLLNRIWQSCTLCLWRSKAKIIDKKDE